jgi:hypothetical protein
MAPMLVTSYNNDRFAYSNDLANWTVVDTSTNFLGGYFVPLGCARSNDLLVMYGSWGSSPTKYSMHTSTDGSSWTRHTFPVRFFANSMMSFANGRFIIVGEDSDELDHVVLSSTNGETWTEHYRSPRSTSIISNSGFVTYNQTLGLYSQAGSSNYGLGEVCTSPDLINWTLSKSGHSFNRVISQQGVFFVGAHNTDSLKSSDGTIWVAFAESVNLTPKTVEVCFGLGMFLLLNYSNGNIYKSDNAIDWTTIDYTASGFDIGWFNDKFVIFNGYEIATSSDGVNWIESNIGDGTATYNHYTFSYEDPDYVPIVTDRWRNYVRSAERNI